MNKTISFINIFIDYLILVFSIYCSLWLRFNGAIPPNYINIFLNTAWFIAAGKIIIFLLFRIYKIIIKFIHTYDVITILIANIVSTIFFALIILIFKSNQFLYPRSVIIIDFILSFIFIAGLRFVEKFLWKPAKNLYVQTQQKVLIIGAGEAGSMALREIRNHPHAGMQIVGFIDDDKSKLNMSIGGKKVLGNRNSIPDLVQKYNIDMIIIALPSAGQKAINDIVNICENTDAKLKIIPSTYEIIAGDVKFEQIRDVKIEDLLGREEIKLDNKEIEKYIKNKVVLITGAGGSIGSEIARQVNYFKPKKLILLGRGENNIFDIINSELSPEFKNLDIHPVICDIRNKNKTEKVFKEFKPDIMFHAAAHKHVYLMELHPDEAFKNNIIGTLILAELAVKYQVERFVLLSTDKAVKPKSIMGMTKLIAEKLIAGYMQKSKKTKFASVRFGNVLGSKGSLVPIYKKQIAQGGPVIVRHPEATRYFMTIPEAVQLVLEAGGIAKGGEIFILDMGKPVKIIDLARKMIKLSGYVPDKDIKIKYTALKPGEKLSEELINDHESVNSTEYDKILITRPEKINLNRLINKIKQIDNNLYKYNRNEIKKIIKNLI